MLPSNCRYSIDAKAVIVVEPARKAFQVCIHERVSPSSERIPFVRANTIEFNWIRTSSHSHHLIKTNITPVSWSFHEPAFLVIHGYNFHNLVEYLCLA